MDPKFFPLIFDSVPVGVFTVDRDRKITSFNKAAEEMTGFSRGDAIGRSCHEVLCASICDAACPLSRSIETKRPVQDRQVWISTKSGDALPVAVTTAAVRDGDRVMGGVEIFRNLSQLVDLRKQLSRRYVCEDIVGKSPAILRLLNRLPLYGNSASPVLIEGAGGTGKKLVARVIHNLGPRKARAFVAVHCAALPEDLLEIELFGDMSRASQPAAADRPGRMIRAHGGSIFIDEVADFSPAAQIRLLRVLRAGEVELGGVENSVPVDVRIIAASAKNLEAEVAAGRFRRDVYDHLKVINVRLPPLSQRTEDIPLLVSQFIDQFNAIHGRQVSAISDQALAALMEAPFPGNIRELRNAIEYAFVVCRGSTIEAWDLPAHFSRSPRPDPTLDNPLLAAEASAIRSTLILFQGNRTKAAESLGISRHTLWRKMKKLGLLESPP